MPTTEITMAIGGHADNDRRNIEALLTDWLKLAAPDEEGYYELPDRFESLTIYVLLTDGEIPKGIKPALDLVSSIDGAKLHLVTDEVTGPIAKWTGSVDKVHETDDPFETLVDLLAEPKSSYLFINWDEQDPDDDQLIKLAHKHKTIRVCDLIQGLQQILPGDEDDEDDEPQDEQEEEQEAKKPAPRTRKSKQEVLDLDPEEQELDEKPLPATEKKQEAPQAKAASNASSLEEEVAAAQRQVTATLTKGERVISRELLGTIYGILNEAGDYLLFADRMNALKNRANETKQSPLTEAVAQVCEQVRVLWMDDADDAPEKPTEPVGKTYKAVWDEDENTWKKAGRGRVRAGVRTAQIDEQGNVFED